MVQFLSHSVFIKHKCTVIFFAYDKISRLWHDQAFGPEHQIYISIQIKVEITTKICKMIVYFKWVGKKLENWKNQLNFQNFHYCTCIQSESSNNSTDYTSGALEKDSIDFKCDG